jgi:hypothetical protein
MKSKTERYAVVLLLLAALAGHAQQVAPRSPAPRAAAATLTPAFRPAAEAALDAIEVAGDVDGSAAVAFEMQLAKANGELNRAKREVRTRQDAIAAQKLLRAFNVIRLCRLERGLGADRYGNCLEDRRAKYDDAAAAIGAKTWKIINELAAR